MPPQTEIAAPPSVPTSLDDRIVKLSFEVKGQLKTYTNLFISAVGVRYANPLQNEATITIYNLDPATQNYLLTETSPYNANWSPKSVILEAGRISYGTSLIYTGNIAYAGVTQAPDVGIILKCLSGNFLKSSIISRTQPASSTLEQIAQATAADAELQLKFYASQKNVSNYAYAGNALGQIAALAQLGQLNAYEDLGSLIVKDAGVAIDSNFRPLSASTGMIGIPELTERGVRVKFFIDNQTVLGQGIELTSEVYPGVNGRYIIYQLAFIVTNRLVPFYYIADCARPPVSEQSYG